MMNSELELAAWTTDIVSAYVSNNAIAGEKLPEFIGSIYTALSTVSSQMVEQPKVELKPAVPVKKSLTPEYLICLEDGKKFKSLKRHLQAITACLPTSTGRSGDCRAITRWWLPPTPPRARIWPRPWDWAGAREKARPRRPRLPPPRSGPSGLSGGSQGRTEIVWLAIPEGAARKPRPSGTMLVQALSR